MVTCSREQTTHRVLNMEADGFRTCSCSRINRPSPRTRLFPWWSVSTDQTHHEVLIHLMGTCSREQTHTWGLDRSQWWKVWLPLSVGEEGRDKLNATRYFLTFSGTPTCSYSVHHELLSWLLVMRQRGSLTAIWYASGGSWMLAVKDETVRKYSEPTVFVTAFVFYIMIPFFILWYCFWISPNIKFYHFQLVSQPFLTIFFLFNC